MPANQQRRVGGVFRFTIRFSGYPKSAPQVIFHEPLPFHPCVSDNGVFSCAFDPRIAQWQHGVFVFELLAAIKYVFYVVPEAHEHCNNHEAVEVLLFLLFCWFFLKIWQLLKWNRQEFVSRASASVVASGVAIEDELRRSSSSDDNTDSEDAATETHSSIRFDEFEQRHADVLTLLRANGPGRAGHVKQLASLVLRKLSALA